MININKPNEDFAELDVRTANSTPAIIVKKEEIKEPEQKVALPKKKDPRFIDVPEEWKPYVKSAYERYPELPKGTVETVLMMESSMGTNKTNQSLDYGKYGYLGGITKTGGFNDTMTNVRKNPAIETKYKILEKTPEGKYKIPSIDTIDTPEAAINVVASELQKNVYKHPEGTDIGEVYFKSYVTAPQSDTPERRELFKSASKYYAE